MARLVLPDGDAAKSEQLREIETISAVLTGGEGGRGRAIIAFEVAGIRLFYLECSEGQWKELENRLLGALLPGKHPADLRGMLSFSLIDGEKPSDSRYQIGYYGPTYGSGYYFSSGGHGGPRGGH